MRYNRTSADGQADAEGGKEEAAKGRTSFPEAHPSAMVMF